MKQTAEKRIKAFIEAFLSMPPMTRDICLAKQDVKRNDVVITLRAREWAGLRLESTIDLKLSLRSLIAKRWPKNKSKKRVRR